MEPSQCHDERRVRATATYSRHYARIRRPFPSVLRHRTPPRPVPRVVASSRRPLAAAPWRRRFLGVQKHHRSAHEAFLVDARKRPHFRLAIFILRHDLPPHCLIHAHLQPGLDYRVLDVAQVAGARPALRPLARRGRICHRALYLPTESLPARVTGCRCSQPPQTLRSLNAVVLPCPRLESQGRGPQRKPTPTYVPM